jgi:CRP-like cAMP-binding protein
VTKENVWFLLELPPIARRSDPVTSHLAAEQITASGARSKQAAACLAAVRMNPGSTSAELAVAAGIDRYTAARRLPELRARGEVSNGPARLCRVTGRAALTWVVA